MNLEQVEKIAEAVLYEGYMLYPYRPSSVKNQRRWNFGVLCPEAYCERQHGSESWAMQTECLLKTTSSTRMTVKVRFLQIVKRTVGRVLPSGHLAAEEASLNFELVQNLELNGRMYRPWEEAVERDVTISDLDLSALKPGRTINFKFPAGDELEYLRDEQDQVAGVISRQWETLCGAVSIQAHLCNPDVNMVTVGVTNLTTFPVSTGETRDEALTFSLVSAHTILGVKGGEFISLLEPPPGFEDLVAQCKNIGTWPVLAGEGAETVLSSPIILYDHPQIAPESAGNLFDSTEIDEILSLRILTLTDDEKREMRQSDDRTREILERTENMPDEQFMKLHGVLRGISPLKEEAR